MFSDPDFYELSPESQRIVIEACCKVRENFLKPEDDLTVKKFLKTLFVFFCSSFCIMCFVFPLTSFLFWAYVLNYFFWHEKAVTITYINGAEFATTVGCWFVGLIIFMCFWIAHCNRLKK